MRFKYLGRWQRHDWRRSVESVGGFAGGLHEIGVSADDTVMIIGGNKPRIYYAIAACQTLGAAPAPVHADVSGQDLVHLLHQSQARYAVAEDQQQVDALLDAMGQYAELRAVIYTAKRGLSNYDKDLVIDYEDLRRRGAAWRAGEFERAIEATSPDAPAMILFNSGLDAQPAGALLSHANLLAAARGLAERLHFTPDDEYLSFMPVSLAPSILCGYVASLLTGGCLSCPESQETVLEDLRELSPTRLYGSPNAYKRIMSLIHDRIALARGLPRKLYERCLGSRDQRSGRSYFGNLLVCAPIRSLYGLGRMRTALIGGDAASSEVLDFFETLGVPLKELYGTAETCGCITLQEGPHSPGNVGTPVGDMQVKIADDGEILCRGPHIFSGYSHAAEDTAKAKHDGWFATGDLGALDADGALSIFGAKNDPTCAAADGGPHPKGIENELKSSPYIREAVVADAAGGGCVALVCIDADTVGTWADGRGVRYTGYADLTRQAQVHELLQREVARANARLDARGHGRVAAFAVLHRLLDPKTHEITWTNKPQKAHLLEAFRPLFDALSGGDARAAFADPLSGEHFEVALHRMQGAEAA